jgi:hypothetical protein
MFIRGRPSSRAGTLHADMVGGPALARQSGCTRHRARDADSITAGDVTSRDVLILSADPLAATLLGAAVELAGRVPHFPEPGEAARAALLRLRPRVTLIDCDHEEACTESFIGPALMTGSRVQLFSSHRTTRDANGIAQRLGLSVATLPMEWHALANLLHDLPGSST